MSSERWERLAPLSGIAFVALMIGAQPFIGSAEPDTSKPASLVARSLIDNATMVRIGAIVSGLAALALVWFGGSLRARFSRFEPSARLSSVAFAGTIVMATFLLLTAVMMIGAVDLADWVKSEESARAAVALSQAMYLGVLYGVVLLLIPSAVLTFRTRALPRGLGILAVIAGLISLVGIWPFGPLGGLLALVWVVGASVSMLRTPASAELPPRA